jgi:hypothetical protein
MLDPDNTDPSRPENPQPLEYATGRGFQRKKPSVWRILLIIVLVLTGIAILLVGLCAMLVMHA